MTAARGARQADIVPAAELARVAAVVVGCGAIGSWLAKSLAHLGVPRLRLVDFDAVAEENVALQGFVAADLGAPKVKALRRAVREIHPAGVVDAVPGRFTAECLAGLPAGLDRVVVCACVDSIDARRAIFEASRDACGLYLDGRMSGLSWAAFAVDDPLDRHYERTLFPAAEATPERCTAKGTVFTAMAPALQMGASLVLWLKGHSTREGTLPREVRGDLFTASFSAR